MSIDSRWPVTSTGPSQDLDPHGLLDAWRLAMLAEGLSPTSAKMRAGVVARAAAAGGVPVHELTTDGLRHFLARYRNGHTLSTYHRSVAAFTGFLVTEGHTDQDPMARIRPPRRPKGLPRPCPLLGLHRLLALDLTPQTRAAVTLAAFAGLRVAEIAPVRGEDVDLEAGTLRVLGKGDKTAVLPIHPEVAALASRMPATGLWFPSPVLPGQPVAANTISIRVSKAMRAAGIREGGAHRLRHLFATLLLDGGASARETQELLRHADLASTQVYTLVTAVGLRAAVLRLPGLPGPDAGGAP